MPQTQTDNPTAATSSPVRGADVISLRNTDPDLYQDLRALAAMMPENYREIFNLRHGLGGPMHSLAEIADITGSTPGRVRSRLEVCLWNCHRAGQHHYEELSAIRRLLGPDRNQWAPRAWAQAGRCDQIAARMAETRLLLAIGGMDVPQIQQVVGQHAVQAGALSANPWGAPLTRRERAKHAKPALDRILKHTIWPATPRTPWEPDTFSAKRSLDDKWAGKTNSGYFHSAKLDRMVTYDSAIEHEMLRHLDADDRVVDLIEQPLTVSAVFGAGQHLYTPDIAVRLGDGRVVVIEVKGPVRLGEFTHWMRWTALARHCELNGYGLYIGNCQTGSILDHYIASRNGPYRDLVRALADQGTPSRSDNHVALQAEDQIQISQAVTAELLAWAPGSKGGVTNPTGVDMEKARGFWHLIGTHARYLEVTPQKLSEAPEQSFPELIARSDDHGSGRN
jgi:ribosomal protein S28E/S33